MVDRMWPEYDYRPGADLRIEDLKTTSNAWRSHVYAQSTTYVPKDFVWQQVLQTEDYRSWLGLDLSPLPRRFSLGTRLTGRKTTAVVGEYQEGFSLHLYYDDSLLVLEVGGQKWPGPVLVGAQDQQTTIRLCLDIFYRSSFARMMSSTKRQRDQAGDLLRRFVAHCQLAYMGKVK